MEVCTSSSHSACTTTQAVTRGPVSAEASFRFHSTLPVFLVVSVITSIYHTNSFICHRRLIIVINAVLKIKKTCLSQISSPLEKPDVSIQPNDSDAVHVQVFNPECRDNRKVMTQNMMIIMMITFKMATDKFQGNIYIYIYNCNCWLSFTNSTLRK